MRRAYLDGETGQIHVRVSGTGTPVLLLPDAPGSGAAMVARAAELIASGHWVAVPDLIGAGGTTCDDALAGDLAAQARLAAGVITGLAWPHAEVIGSGAGAAVARRLAADRPDLVAGVTVLDEPYAGDEPVPDVPAELDRHGEHLVRLWHELRDHHLFHPYWRMDAEHRRMWTVPDAALLHEVFADTLPHGGAHRRLAEAARRAWRSAADLDHPTSSAIYDQHLSYVDVPHGQLHVRARRGTGSEPPIVLLHASPGSSQGLAALLNALGRDRLAVAVDLPGHGRSDPLPIEQRDGATLAGTYLPALLRVLDALGLDRVDVYGTHTGAGLAAELAIHAPDRVRALTLDGVPLFDDEPELVRSVLADYFVDLTPDRHGSHLIRAWNATWDMGLWWPWFRQEPDGVREGGPYPVDLVHRVTADMLRSAPTYYVAYRAAFTWLATHRLPRVTRPALIGSTLTDPLRPATLRALALIPDARKATFPAGAPAELARQITAFGAGHA